MKARPGRLGAGAGAAGANWPGPAQRGRRALPFIEALAEVWAQRYRHVWWGEPLRLESFLAERMPRSFTEDPAMATTGRSRWTTCCPVDAESALRLDWDLSRHNPWLARRTRCTNWPTRRGCGSGRCRANRRISVRIARRLRSPRTLLMPTSGPCPLTI